MNRLKILVFIFSFCLGLTFAHAQGKTVTGQVVSSEDGEGLPGVTVLVEGSNVGTTTDIAGNFRINVTPDNTLIFSFVGFTTQRRKVGNQTSFPITMKPDLKSLDEVVVLGYGTVRKSDLTGSVSSVGEEELTAFPALSAVQTLQGRAPGLQIQSNNGGQPGANYNIKIRGGTSINATSDPIRVVDGFVGAEMPPPEDIASIEILKDASATAIYGSRGANGVIMITTKRGKSGKAKINLTSSFSIQEVLNRLDLLNADQFTSYIREINPDYTPGGPNTDWQELIYRPGTISNNQLSISGGSDDISYYLSGTAFNQKGVIDGSNYDRYTINSNLNITPRDFLTIGVNLYGRRSLSGGINTQESTGGSGSAGVVSSAFRFNPDIGVFNPDGSYAISEVGDDIDNPVALTSEYSRERVTDRFQASTFGEVTLTEWLKFKSTFGVTISNSREGEFFPTTLIRGAAVGGRALLGSEKNTNILNENYFTINPDLNGVGNLSVVMGYSYQKLRNEDLEARSFGFVSNSLLYWSLEGGANPDIPRSRLSEQFIRSYYSRVNYSFLDKYLLTFTARYDGASNFASNKKWAFFPSGALGWDMKGEPFLEDIGVITTWKWRASYGMVGNQAIGAYQSLANLDNIYTTGSGYSGNAVTPSILANPNLTWETTVQLDLGVDIGLFNGRVNLAFDYYEKETKDLLFERPLPRITGYDYQLQNIGRLENKGIEIALGTKNFVGDFEWDTDLNLSANRNKVLELPDNNTDVFYGSAPGHFGLGNQRTGQTQVIRVGQPIGVFYGYVYDRVYQNGDEFLPGSGFEQDAGGEKFIDLNDDNRLDSEDREIIGDPNPDFIWGFNNVIRYKNFDLNVFLQGQYGGDMLSYTLMELDVLSGANNASTTALDRWTPFAPNTDVPKASNSRAKRISSRWVYDGTYTRLKNVILGYTLPKTAAAKLKLASLRVYVSAQNLLTFTSFPGLDPEVGYRNGSNSESGNIMRGLDYGSYPNVKNYTVGLKIGI